MDRLALVIGNADYQHVNKLVNPVNDADDMAISLEKVGFIVVRRVNTSLNDIQSLATDFLKKLENYNTGLFYYAGHGMQIDGKNYIVPVDCKLSNKAQTVLSCFCIDDFLGRISVYREKTIICILDACRDNPFASGRGVSTGFTEFHNQPRGTIIAFSTSVDCTASDGQGRNGLYTEELKRAVLIPNIKIEDMFKRVRITVAEKSLANTGVEQVSREHSSLTGDFYFSIKQQSTPVSSMDEEIYKYICERFQHYEKSKENISDIECLSYVDAYNYFHTPLIILLRAYSKIQYAKEGKHFSDAVIDQLNYSYLTTRGFHQTDGRWYYKDHFIEMGDLLPLPKELSQQEPILGQEIKIGGRIVGEIIDGRIRFILYSNIPEHTPLIFSLTRKKYKAQCSVDAGYPKTASSEFSKKGNPLPFGRYRLEITAPIHSVLPTEIKELFGDRNRNITGRFVKFDPIWGNTIHMCYEILFRKEEVIVIE